MFFRKKPKEKPPILMVLQTESVLVKFEANTSLPLRLETNNVCDCVCLIIYSKLKGLAYLGHIFLRELNANIIEQYQDSIYRFVESHRLNSHNTFVALIGSDADTLTQRKIIETILKKYFTVITKFGDGKPKERCIELSDDQLEIITLEFFEKNIRLAYEKYDTTPIRTEKSNNKKRINDMIYYINGRDESDNLPEEINITSINEKLKNTSDWYQLQNTISSTISSRNDFLFFATTTLENEYEQKATVSTFKNVLSLNKNSHISMQESLFYCIFFKPNLFHFIIEHIGLDQHIKFDENTINRLRYPTIQTLIKSKKISGHDIESMTPVAENILNNDAHRSFLFNNMNPNEILHMTTLNQPISEALLKIDALIASEDMSIDQLPYLSFKDIENIYAGNQKGIQSMSYDNILHHGNTEFIEEPFKTPILTPLGIMVSK